MSNISILKHNLPEHILTLIKQQINPDDLPLVGKPQDWQLRYQNLRLALYAPPALKFSPLDVDFVEGAVAHRRKFGGGKGQDIAKAVGLGKTNHLHIADFTAGLGRDAFVFATLGCQVTLFERQSAVQLLLADGIERARLHQDTQDLAERMTLHFGDSRSFSGDECFDVVYLDPMFPSRKKSALVKKDMQMFHQIVGEDLDSDELFDVAWQHAKYRVVVKRPKGAPFLADKKPTLEFGGKTGRFDVYVKQGFKESQ